ncbi:MAG: hypothetical protein HY782_15930 [Chloroflexi bacterium]|nr:hypothetical protein [Chloroflexota bacterium]
MVKTINLKAEVTTNREVRIVLPDDIPLGPAEIVVVVASPGSGVTRTLGEFARSEFFGMWRDRAKRHGVGAYDDLPRHRCPGGLSISKALSGRNWPCYSRAVSTRKTVTTFGLRVEGQIAV